ncbi:hypothetical protein Vadar_030559 [Vaccinium darrowii]|uniref:Uncharacterized protein n=1 Tax=Vaccinium darrowii TaxID=229202 RepID=A0ACB7ZP10_9ERIC|nr:hypothetical protein Vadar_030559 [Vaccinium darrowii]
MNSSNLVASSVAVLVLLLLASAKGDHNFMPPGSWPPSSWPNFGNMCSEVKCGKGNCTVDSSYPFNFQCECEDGWMRTHLFNDTNLKFLPCIVPNCSLNYSCMPAAPPVPAIPYNNNYSFFDRN